MLNLLEEMLFSGEFEDSCPFCSVVEILEKLVVVRNHRRLDDFFKMCELADKYRKYIELLSCQIGSNNLIDGNNIVQPSDKIKKIKSIVDRWPPEEQTTTQDIGESIHNIRTDV
jgi:hypothetical protein